MQETLLEIINTYGYLGIMLLICIENVFPPIPSEVVLIFSGFMTLQSEMSVLFVIISATIGSTTGAIVLYYLGRIMKKERLKRLFNSRFGKIMHLKAESIDLADKWFSKYEYKAVFICRCIPIVRSLISIPAGITEMKPLPFLILTITGSAIWNTVLVWVGVTAGEAWESRLAYVESYTHLAIVALVAICLAAGIYFYYKKRKRTK